MSDFRMGAGELRFADLIWENAPIGSGALAKLALEHIGWKKTTTYTVLKKLCDKGLFKTENSVITSVISRKEFYAIQSERFVEDAFDGSLPAFIAAFASRKKPDKRELDRIRLMLEELDKEDK